MAMIEEADIIELIHSLEKRRDNTEVHKKNYETARDTKGATPLQTSVAVTGVSRTWGRISELNHAIHELGSLLNG